MTSTYIAKLGVVIQKTDIKGQKIDNSSLIIYGIILIGFLVYNKLANV